MEMKEKACYIVYSPCSYYQQYYYCYCSTCTFTTIDQKTPVSLKPVESSEEEPEQQQEEEEDEDKEELEESQKIFDPEEWDEEEDTKVSSK